LVITGVQDFCDNELLSEMQVAAAFYYITSAIPWHFNFAEQHRHCCGPLGDF
jgi:hypothetical protein